MPALPGLIEDAPGLADRTANLRLVESRLDIVQRTMLRRMVGWVSHTGDAWEDRGRRMKQRLSQCLDHYPVAVWSDIINGRKDVLLRAVAPHWTRSSVAWAPKETQWLNHVQAYRCVGRPLTRCFQ